MKGDTLRLEKLGRQMIYLDRLIRDVRLKDPEYAAALWEQRVEVQQTRSALMREVLYHEREAQV